MSYESSVEILEAMGVETAWGSREWIDGYHRDDLWALAQGLFFLQLRQVQWKCLVAGDPFEWDLRRWEEELMISRSTRQEVKFIKPSYMTYKKPKAYLAAKVLEFYLEVLPPKYRPLTLWHELKGMTLTFYAVPWNVDQENLSPSDHVALVSVPTWHTYENSTRLKAELIRVLCCIAEALITHQLVTISSSREYMYRAVQFVDSIWGSEPLD